MDDLSKLTTQIIVEEKVNELLKRKEINGNIKLEQCTYSEDKDLFCILLQYSQGLKVQSFKFHQFFKELNYLTDNFAKKGIKINIKLKKGYY